MRNHAWLLVLVGCSTTAEDNSPADRGNIVFSLYGETFESSRPGEYTSGGGDSSIPLLVLAHGGDAPGLRSHQSGTGPAAQLVADSNAEDVPALDVQSGGPGPNARFTGGRVAIGPGSTLVLESVARVSASARIAPEGAVSALLIEASEGTQANVIEIARPVEGQLLFVTNDDDDPATLGNVRIAPGETRQLLYLGGRFRAS
jgi:hypothetical protein